jgi:hypothetical protein
VGGRGGEGREACVRRGAVRCVARGLERRTWKSLVAKDWVRARYCFVLVLVLSARARCSRAPRPGRVAVWPGSKARLRPIQGPPGRQGSLPPAHHDDSTPASRGRQCQHQTQTWRQDRTGEGRHT